MANYFVLVNGVRTDTNYGYAGAAKRNAFGLSLNPDTIATVVKEDDNGAEVIIGTYRGGDYGATERYYIYDHLANGDAFDRVFDADSFEAALDIARAEWDALSEHDKARRSEFLVGVVSAEAVAACEDGMDSLLNYMTNVVNLKEEA